MFVSIQSYSQIFGNVGAIGTVKRTGGGELGIGYRFGEEKTHGVMLGYHSDMVTDLFTVNVSYLYHLNDFVFKGGVVVANPSIDTKARTFYTYIVGANYNFCYLEDKLVDGNFYVGVDLIKDNLYAKVGLRFVILAKKDRRTNLVSTPNR